MIKKILVDLSIVSRTDTIPATYPKSSRDVNHHNLRDFKNEIFLPLSSTSH